ncbi:MAG: thioester domain-containing protein, partial [Intestinibacter sp.]
MKKIIKKLKWVFPIFLFGIVSLIATTKAKALTSDSFYFEWITPKIYVNKYKNGVERSERIQVYHKRSDSEIAYCIEPGIDFSDSATLTGYDYNQSDISGMSIDTWRRITLLAYYGYGYGNHTDSKWYAITQYEIWKANPLGWDMYWADSFHGNNISQFESESAELLNLVNNHYKAPSFANSNNTVVVNDTIVLDDTNNVLSNYEVSTNDNATIKKDGNKLYITPNKVGD